MGCSEGFISKIAAPHGKNWAAKSFQNELTVLTNTEYKDLTADQKNYIVEPGMQIQNVRQKFWSENSGTSSLTGGTTGTLPRQTRNLNIRNTGMNSKIPRLK